MYEINETKGRNTCQLFGDSTEKVEREVEVTGERVGEVKIDFKRARNSLELCLAREGVAEGLDPVIIKIELL